LEQRATGELSILGSIGTARKLVRNLLEQRAGEGFSKAKPIGAARRTYWSSAQVSQKPIGTARRWVQTYWNSAQVILTSHWFFGFFLIFSVLILLTFSLI
jgi:hypothetical protein